MLDFEKLPRFKAWHFQIMDRVPEWAAAYQVPIEAIERQIPIAHGWIGANPKKAPRKEPIRFLWNWMRKAKEFGNLTPVAALPKPPPPEPEPTMSFEEMRAITRRNLGERRTKERSVHELRLQSIEGEQVVEQKESRE